jgi:hypothetical protein
MKHDHASGSPVNQSFPKRLNAQEAWAAMIERSMGI